MKKTIFIKLLVVMLVGVSLLNGDEGVKFKYADTNMQRQTPTSQDYILSYNKILKNVTPSVVNISTKTNVSATAQGNPFMNDPFFREFFRGYGQGRVPKDRIQRSLGSGVIISSNGYIVTNNHVVDGADEIKVTLKDDKKEYDAKVIGKDAKSDLAIIKIDAKGLQAITFYNSDDVKVGDIVFAIGTPFGVGETITQGIVSATGRSSMGIAEYENFIQTDASINPGNSGGALINSAGHLIGINSAIISRSGGNVGIGFAIPSNMVASIAPQLIEKGRYSRAYLGVSISDINEDMSRFYNHSYGALVTGIQDDTPAQKAGLKRGDLIIGVNNDKIESASELKNKIGSFTPEKKVTIYFLRDKNKESVDVTLASQVVKLAANSFEYKGMKLQPLSKLTQQQLGANIQGVLVAEVEPLSEAAGLNLAKGDIIIQVENQEIKNIKDFQKATQDNNKKMIYIYRQGYVFPIVL